MNKDHKKQVKQVLNPIQYSNVSKIDSFMYKMGVKAGYRLAIEHLENKHKSKTNPVKHTYIINKYKKEEIDNIANNLLNEVCNYYNISANILLSDNRCRKYTIPRSVLINLLRATTKLNLSQIAYCVKRHHATVIHQLSLKDNKQMCWKESNQQIYNAFNTLVSTIQQKVA